MERVIISAPFGNYISQAGCTSTIGTFTLKYRGNFAYRLWRMARTLRYDRMSGGWVNKLGLPNPGIESLPPGHPVSDKIISIHGFDTTEWYELADKVARWFEPAAVELNVSCPNVTDSSCSDWTRVFREIKAKFKEAENNTPLIVKLPPVNYRVLVDAAIEASIFRFHACNTLPCKRGGMSGPILRQFVTEIIKYIKTELTSPDMIVAGGGIQSVDDARRYIDIGASHVAVGSALLNPLRLKLPSKLAEALEAVGNPKADGVGG